MSTICFENVTAKIAEKVFLKGINLDMAADERWAIVGANGSGKSAFGRLLCNELPIVSGIAHAPAKSAYVSFEKLEEVLAVERYNDDTDFLDYIDEGTVVTDFIVGPHASTAAKERLAVLGEQLRFTGILGRGLRFLSTGEMRKVLIGRALMAEPELLVLDEPFDGLDQASAAALAELIGDLWDKGMTVVLLLNRFTEILPHVTDVAYIKDCQIVVSGRRDELLNSEALLRLHNFHNHLPAQLPPVDQSLALEPLPAGTPLVEMKQVTVRYDEKTILNRLSWRVMPGEHWRISGPNGAGKTTLLNLINGDNPQAYANDIHLFGIRKGSGESVWDIKKHLGLVSSSLQQEYRVSVTVKAVVVSGFFDSIGVYQEPSKTHLDIASAWLDLLHMADYAARPFRGLSYGEQRLVLIARAMIKQPHLLILDEPCQGLDDVNREMVLKLVDHLGRTGRTQILYVSHHREDVIPCIEHELVLVPAAGGGYTANVSVA